VTAPRNGLTCLIGGPAGQFCGLTFRPLDPGLGNSLPGPGYQILAGPVQPRVTRVEVLLADGQRLVLHPAATFGQRWVAVALPRGTQVSRAVAYHGRAVYRYTIPFNGPPGRPTSPHFVTWLRPGAAGLPREAFTVASGTAGGHRWSVTEYTGPWGRCFVLPRASNCLVGDVPVMKTGYLSKGMGSVPGGVHLAAAAAGVTSVELDLSSGQQVRVATRAGFGGERFYAFVLPHGTEVAGWTAYGPDGKRLGSGPGSTLG
jgi:hypothetical protein